VRQEFDGAAILGQTVAKCYFGEPTPIGDEKKYLERPDAGKLFFISPPPSPPIGWEMKNEDPPNKQVHADDLALKLAKLTGKMTDNADGSPTDETSDSKTLYTRDELQKLKTSKPPLAGVEEQSPVRSSPKIGGRSRSSTLIYDPKVHGDSPGLPAVMLETENDSDIELEMPDKKIIAHTSRPPVELMD
jgi:hypothetical protein